MSDARKEMTQQLDKYKTTVIQLAKAKPNNNEVITNRNALLAKIEEAKKNIPSVNFKELKEEVTQFGQKVKSLSQKS